MAGYISLLHEAVRLEANRENFKALTKYLGALAAVSHALLEICENGADALYTNVFDEKISVAGRCFDRVRGLYVELTKPEPSPTTVICAAPILNRRVSRQQQQQQQQNGCSNMRNSLLDSTCSSYELNGTKSSTNGDVPTRKLFRNDRSSSSSLANGQGYSSSETYRLPPSTSAESITTPTSTFKRQQNVSKWSAPSPRRRLIQSSSTSIYENQENGWKFGTVLSALDGEQRGSSVFYDVPTNLQTVFDPTYRILGGENDSDVEAGRDLPDLQGIVGVDVVRGLADKERRRQQAIVELFHIERTHVGRLKVMVRVFFKPLHQNKLLSGNHVDLLPMDTLQLLFGNIGEILDIHMAINRAMKAIMKRRQLITGVGDLMLSFLDGEAGEKLKKSAVAFCQYQQYALDALKIRRKEDKKFHAFLEKAENNPLCRGFPLRDLLPGEMKHLSRYPLLLENILKYTTDKPDETAKLRRCVLCAKEILQAVNSAKKSFDNRRRLAEFQSRLDTHPFDMTNHEIVSAYSNFDLTRYDLIFDCSLIWRIGKKTVKVHLLLVDSLLLLLTTCEYSRYRLSFYDVRASRSEVGYGKKSQLVKFSPLLELDQFEVGSAPDDRVFYIHSRSPPYRLTYELVASSAQECKSCVRAICQQIQSYEQGLENGGIRNLTSASSGASSADDDSQENLYERIDSCSSCGSDADSDLFAPKDEIVLKQSDRIYDDVPRSDLEPNDNRSSLSSQLSNMDLQVPDFPPPAIPDEYAPSIEALKRCESRIIENVMERQHILAALFDIPEDDFSNVADLISSFQCSKSLREYLLVLCDQVSKLLNLICSNGNYSDRQASKRWSLIDPSSWLHHSLIPNLVPSILSLMKHISDLLYFVQSPAVENYEYEAVRMRL